MKLAMPYNSFVCQLTTFSSAHVRTYARTLARAVTINIF